MNSKYIYIDSSDAIAGTNNNNITIQLAQNIDRFHKIKLLWFHTTNASFSGAIFIKINQISNKITCSRSNFMFNFIIPINSSEVTTIDYTDGEGFHQECPIEGLTLSMLNFSLYAPNGNLLTGVNEWYALFEVS